jgi:type IV pilus assembly protein PilA
MLTKFYSRNEAGFTLIELMIVIAIIGILAAIAIPQFSAYRKRSYYAAAQSDIRNLATAQEAYYTDKLTYTDTASDLTASKFGFSQTSHVLVNVEDANQSGYILTATHDSTNRVYNVTGPGGTITYSGD